MSTQPVISTIIISYNTADLTAKAIQSVLQEYQHSHIDGEVIVIDNNSSDSSPQKLATTFSNKIILIRNSQNLGFAAANNQGITKAKGKYFFLLNSDAELHPGSLAALLNIFQKFPDENQTAQQESTDLIDRVGVVSGQLLNSDGTIQKQGGALPSLWTLAVWWLFPLPIGPHLFPTNWNYHNENETFFKSQQKIGWLGGTAMLIRREVIEEVGPLDTNIFMYAEDTEFCLRAAKHHWDIIYTPTAKITHLGSASSSSDRALIGEVAGLEYLFAKHFPAWQSRVAILILKTGAWLRWLLFGILFNNGKKKKTYQEIFRKIGSTA